MTTGLNVGFGVLDQLGTPMLHSNIIAKRPAPSVVGRLFVSTDTHELYRDTGTGWDLIGGSSSGVTGSGVATRVAFWSGTNSISSDSGLYFNPTFDWLGIGTSVPLTKLHAVGVDAILEILETSGTIGSFLAFSRNAALQYSQGYNYNNNSYPHYQIYDEIGAKNVLGVLQSSRFVGINYQFTGATDVPRYTFDVFGSVGGTGTFDFGADTITRLVSTGNSIVTKYLGANYGIDFDYLNGFYYYGNSGDGFGMVLTQSTGDLSLGDFGYAYSGTHLQINNSTQTIFTNTSSTTSGLYLDFVNNYFYINNGAQGFFYNGTANKYFVGQNGDLTDGFGLRISFYATDISFILGDYGSLNNGTYLNIDDNNRILKTISSGSEIGLKLDFANNHSYLGDYNGIINGSYFDADNDNGFAIIRTQGYLNFMADGQSTLIGDVMSFGNGTRFGVFDGLQSLWGSANLLSATAGGSSGQHLKIYINGVQYKIALLNN